MSIPKALNWNNINITLSGFYEYDNTLFGGARIPDGIDKKTLIATILDYCGENISRYGSPSILKKMINNYFEINFYRFNELYKTMNYDYDPLLNYDLTIEVDRTNESNRNLDAGIQSNGSSQLDVSAFDSEDYSHDRKTTDSSNNTTTEQENIGGQDTERRREYGDNSARSTQYMIKEQREIVDYNIYNIIAYDFETAITIPVYTRAESTLWFG